MSSVLFAVFYLLQIWDVQRDDRLLLATGALAGFGYACKYTAFLAVPYAIGFVAWRMRRKFLKAATVMALSSALFIAPWMLKNWIIVANPVSPFLNRVFPSPYVRINFEDDYIKQMRWYEGLRSAWDIPVELTLRGGVLQGLYGPVFLLAPLALLALPNRLARRALFAAILFGLPYVNNVGARFLMGSIPLLSFAMATAFTRWRGLTPALAAFHAVTCWPDIATLYCDPAAWRLDRIRWKQALRIEPEHNYLKRMGQGYEAAILVNQVVPPEGQVLSYGGIAEAYCTRRVLVSYTAGLNNLLGEILTTSVVGPYHPKRFLTFEFPQQELQRIRIVQTAATDQVWSLNEVRLFVGPQELPRSPTWKIRSSPDPWEVQLAFDNCPITRWRSWEPARPGMFVEVDLGKPTGLSKVQMQSSLDHPATRARLEGEKTSGEWVTLARNPEETIRDLDIRLRRGGVEDLKRFGVTHIYVNDTDFFVSDVRANVKEYGITQVGTVPGGRLYRLN
jgi:hypothetical protein